MAHHLAAKEGILTGVTGGSTLTTAVEVAETAPEGSVILVMLPDTGERYLSTPLFEAIPAEMSDEEAAVCINPLGSSRKIPTLNAGFIVWLFPQYPRRLANRSAWK